MNGRVAALAVVAGAAAYVGWVVAGADDFGSPSVWTVLTATVFWIAALVVLAYAVRLAVRLVRRGQRVGADRVDRRGQEPG